MSVFLASVSLFYSLSYPLFCSRSCSLFKRNPMNPNDKLQMQYIHILLTLNAYRNCFSSIKTPFPSFPFFTIPRNSQHSHLARNNQASSNDERPPPRSERRRRNASGSHVKAGPDDDQGIAKAVPRQSSSRAAESRLISSSHSKRKSSDDQDSASTSRNNAAMGARVTNKSSLVALKLTSEKREQA